ncbi:hydrolase [Luteitalea sp. TBR-22]|uniref:hydrolase n=1 Tax=Luteitalea sp. TBR-22 TaxID=2802971 RepID=UPI001AFADB12|nr:hydrolase [Luteitalea sp. TBR-22]BCS35690.1 hydrolase [Luteitalea sp. TBR-22]
MAYPDYLDPNTAESTRLVTPRNATLLLIDYQPQMIFGVGSIDRQLLLNNVEALAKTALAFELPVILTTIAASSFSGPLIPQLARLFPERDAIDRSAINTWADHRVVQEVRAIGRQKLVMAGLWTEVCLTLPVLSALEAGYDVYFVADASGGSSTAAHDLGVQRMVQAGATPLSWVQLLSELQYDWARKETYDAVNRIVAEHAGAWGTGGFYRATFSAAPDRALAAIG